jgi:O-glycosyl hydrolase
MPTRPAADGQAAPPAAPLAVDGATRFQTIDGWGTTVNAANWKNGQVTPALDMLIDRLGCSIIRVSIDNIDWESTNDNADPQSFNWPYYNAIYSSAKWNDLWSTMAYLNKKGITKHLILNFMGPGPAWMGGGTLAAGMDDEFVEMVASVAHYARVTKGLQFGLFAPNNEPDWDAIEGIRMDRFRWPAVMATLAVKLDAMGLGDLRFVGPDTANIAEGTGMYLPQMTANATLMAKLDHYAFHNYSGDTGGAAKAIAASKYPDKNFWMTEYSETEDLFAMLGQGPSALLMWDGFDSVYNHAILAGRGTTPPNDAGNAPAFLSYSPGKGTYTPRKNFYEAAQVFKFVPAGAVRIAATESTTATVYAFHHAATGRVTIVGYHPRENPITFAGTLTNLPGVSAFQLYTTTSTQDMRRGADVPVSNGAFTFTAPGGGVFTLTYGR